jgi:signal peptidase I
MRRARVRIIFGCFALVFGLAAWICLAPPALGGATTYATTFGTSMAPRLDPGDLVLMRAAPPYRVGDVVGYRDSNLKRLVLHRIVGGTAETGFTMKGDNNDFLDPVHPREAQVVGRLTTRVPHAGAIIERFRAPGSAAVLVGGLILLPVRSRRRRGAAQGRTAAPAAGGGDLRRGAVGVLAALAVGLAALAGYSYSRPAHDTVTVADAYEQTGTFSYTARARRGAAYPDGVVRTGEAVFPRLSRRVVVSYDYRVSSDHRTDLAGRSVLEAVVSDGQGWSRTLPLGAPTTFGGPGATLTGTLRLDRLRAMTHAFERETHTKGAEYSVTVRARTTISGTVGGTPVGPALGSSLALHLDRSRLALASSPNAEAPSLDSRLSGSITREAPASLSFAGLSLPVFRARAVGLLGFEAALGAALLLGLPLVMQGRRSEAGAIRMRMGGKLVDVAELPWSAPGGCVDLERMSDLARVADGADLPIMVVEKDDAARYGVVRGEVLYRYATRSGPRTAAAASAGPSMAAVV